MRKIPWWEPAMAGGEYDAVRQVLDANYLNDGDVTRRFERAIAERLGVRHVVAVTSGTAAIFAALAACGVGPGDEVVVPDITFIATANAVRLAGATPVLADVDRATMNLDPSAVARALTPRTKAIVPVHVSGRGADMSALLALARREKLVVVEDAAEALLSALDGRCYGTVGDAGCFSLSPNKTITTGQGGLVATDHDELHDRLREIKDQGRRHTGTGGDDLHPVVGYNLKLTNLQAAVGLAQMAELDRRLARQVAIYQRYTASLAGVPGIHLPGFRFDRGERPQWTDAIVERRAALCAHLDEAGIGYRRFWHPLHTQAPDRADASRFPNAGWLSARALWLPSAFTLSDDDVDAACAAIRAALSAPAM